MTDSSAPESKGSVSSGDALTRAMDEYLRCCERGTLPNRAEFLGRYPEVAGELAECLEGLDFVEAMAPQLRPLPQRDQELDLEGSPSQKLALGDYLILDKLGRGGMGVVYRAKELSLGREVALKVLPFGAMLDQRALERFRNEAHAAAVLRHPGIVSVFSVGCERGVHYYAMELIDGLSIAELLTAIGRERPVAEEESPTGREEAQPTSDYLSNLSTQHSKDRQSYYRTVARLGVEVAKAIQHAHEAGIVHRDIKPSNLLIDRHGRAHVTDFGLATVQSGHELTLTGDMLGTLRYMSPEQASGRRGAVDHRTDIFSLGSTLYELLTGRPALSGDDRQQLLRELDDFTPTAPRKVVHDLPKDLDTIILKSLAPEPLHRYDSALDFAEDLQRFLDLKPIHARRQQPTDVLWRSVQRNPLVTSLAAVLACATLATAIIASYFAAQQRDLAEQRRQALYDASIKQAYGHVVQGEYAHAQRLLRELVPANGEVELRNWEWYFLKRESEAHQYPFIHDWIDVMRLAYSADGKTFAKSLYGGEFAVHDSATNAMLWSDRHKETEVTNVVYSTDGKVLVSCGRRLRFQDALSGEKQREDIQLGSARARMAISKQGVIAVSPWVTLPPQDNSSVRLFHMKRKQGTPDQDSLVVEELGSLDAGSTVRGIAFSPSGDLLAASFEDVMVRIWDTTTWKSLDEFDARAGRIRDLVFSPDGKTLAVGGGIFSRGWQSGELAVWDVDGIRTDQPAAEFQCSLGHHDAAVTSLAFSPDGSRLYSAGSNLGTVNVWRTETFEREVEIRAQSAKILALAVAPHGNQLVSGGSNADSRIVVTDLQRSRPVESLSHSSLYYVMDFEFTRDNRNAFSCDGEGFIKKWSLDDGKLLTCDHHKPFNVPCLCLSSDETKLASVGSLWGNFARLPRMAELQIRDADTLAVVATRGLREKYIRSIDYSPDDRFVAFAGAAVGVWDTHNNTVRYVDCDGGYRCQFSPDGHFLAVGGAGKQGGAQILRFPSLELYWEFAGEQNERDLFGLAFSHDGAQIATGGKSGGKIRIWDVGKKRLVRELDGHRNAAIDLHFSNDGSRLVSGSTDGNVMLWNLHTGSNLLTFRRHAGWVWRVKFSPDGSKIAATYQGADDPPGIRLWSR